MAAKDEQKPISTTSPLGLIAPIAAFNWILLILGGGTVLAIPVLCTTILITKLPSQAEFEYALLWISPVHLSISWIVMILAMMLPVIIGPLIHVQVKSYSQNRRTACLGFLLGYLGVWTCTALPLIAIALFLHFTTQINGLSFLIALVVMVAWQISPWKQLALNRCHSRKPLQFYGSKPFQSGIVFGLNHGFWCVAVCSPIMLTTLTTPSHSILWMIGASLWIWAERLENPKKPMVRLNIPLRIIWTMHYRFARWIKQQKLLFRSADTA